MKRKAFTLIELIVVIAIVVLIGSILTTSISGCDQSAGTKVPQPKSTTGVQKATADIEVGSDGLTAEQRNIKRRIQNENVPGSIKHLYVLSAYSGDILMYSTVDGKITSSGKRLSPYTVHAGAHSSTSYNKIHHGIPVDIGGTIHHTSEVLQDDGTYGSSIPYIYWWDQAGVYRQQYITGGMTLHIADQPIEFGRVRIQVDTTTQDGE